MALIKCPDCEREISNRAVACPHCGCPVESVTSTNKNERAGSNKKAEKENKSNLVFKADENNNTIIFTQDGSESFWKKHLKLIIIGMVVLLVLAVVIVVVTIKKNKIEQDVFNDSLSRYNFSSEEYGLDDYSATEEDYEIENGLNEENNRNAILNLGDTFIFNNFELKLGVKYSFTTVDNQFSDLYQEKIIRIPVEYKNNGSETNRFGSLYTKYFGPHGTQLENCYGYFDDCIEYNGELKPGSTAQAAIYIVYDGDGVYSIDFDNMTNRISVEFQIGGQGNGSGIVVAEIEQSTNTTTKLITQTTQKVTEKTTKAVEKTTKASENKYALGQTFDYKDFRIIFKKDISFTTVENSYYEHNGATAIKVVATIKNNGSETKNIPTSQISFFGSNGSELEDINYYFRDSYNYNSSLRPNGTVDAVFYLRYDGNGVYSIRMCDWIVGETDIIEFKVSK